MGSLEQAVYAIIISFVIGVILCPIVIPMLRKLKFGQNVRDDGPQTHLAKQGTPTMGGVAFLAAFVITSLFFLKGNRDGAAIMLMTLCYGLIGFLDDYIKVVKKSSLGLRAYQKLLLQLIVTGLFCSYIMKSGIGTAIYIPFTDGKMIDLQSLPVCGGIGNSEWGQPDGRSGWAGRRRNPSGGGILHDCGMGGRQHDRTCLRCDCGRSDGVLNL